MFSISHLRFLDFKHSAHKKYLKDHYLCPMDLYNDMSGYLTQKFPFKVQKISINGGFTCPNRDGSKGIGGCTYCNNQTFHPHYCQPTKSIAQQLKEGIAFFGQKYPKMHYLAYFQSYTNTYKSIDLLQKMYKEALSFDKVEGLIIGTRPDCVSDQLLDYLKEINQIKWVMIEYGVESTIDRTLQSINRGHDYAAAVDAIHRTAARGLDCGAHIILGLPGESDADILSHAVALGELPIRSVKLHQLQIIRSTVMAQELEKDPSSFQLFSLEEYLNCVIDFIELLPPSFVLDRFVSQSPKELLIAPDWGIKNHVFVEMLKKKMREQNSYQGRLFSHPKSR